MAVTSLLRKIVKNEAMQKDPDAIYNWRVFVVAASVSIAFRRILPVDTELMERLCLGLLRCHVLWLG